MGWVRYRAARLRQFCPIIVCGEPDVPALSFDLTDRFRAVKGPGLQRRLVTSAKLAPPECNRGAELACHEIEAQLAQDGARRVNLDIGYLDDNTIVLASVNFTGQKIHLGDGVYADLIARYSNGKYEPFEWTLPDFLDGRYDEQLATIRREYLSAVTAISR